MAEITELISEGLRLQLRARLGRKHDVRAETALRARTDIVV